MNNVRLFNKILSANIDGDFENVPIIRGYNTDDSFEKYYDFNIIKKAIKKYHKKEITVNMFTNWLIVYNNVISSGLNFSDIVTYDQVIKENISNALELMSYCDDDVSYFKNSKRTIFALNILYKEQSKYEVICAKDELEDEDDLYIFLAINHKKKKYYINYMADQTNFDVPELPKNYLIFRLQKILKKGYTTL